MINWGNETKPRSGHSGRLGMDAILKDARAGNLKAVQSHLRKDPSLLHAKSGGHNRTFLWEATRGNRVTLVKHLLELGADPNVPGRNRAEIPVLLMPYCIARHYRRDELAELLREAGAVIDLYSACFLGDMTVVQSQIKSDRKLLTAEQDDDTVWRVTPLHFAVCAGNESLVRWLIDQGAKVKPYTRLLCNIAVRMKHADLLPLLLEAGADPALARDWARLRPG